MRDRLPRSELQREHQAHIEFGSVTHMLRLRNERSGRDGIGHKTGAVSVATDHSGKHPVYRMMAENSEGVYITQFLE